MCAATTHHHHRKDKAMPAAVLTIDINARLAGLEDGLKRLEQGVNKTGKSLKDGFSSVEDTIIHFGRSLAGAIGIPLGAHELLALIGEIKDKTTEAQRAQNQLSAVLRNTGMSAGLTAKDLADLGEELRHTSIFDDTEIKQAEVALLRFRSVQGDTFRDTLRAAPGVAAALGVDLVGAVTVMGRALNEQGTQGMRGLKAAGLSLSETQLDLAQRMIETGNRAGAQRIKLDELIKSTGGLSEADNTGLYGSTKRLSRAFKELSEASGEKLFAGAVETGDVVIGFLERLKQRIDDASFSFSKLITKPGELASQAGRIALDLAKGLPDKTKEPTRQVSGKIDTSAVDADAAFRAQLEHKITDAQEQSERERRELLKRNAESAASLFQGRFDDTKRELDRETTQYQFAYEQRYIATSEFFDKERSLARDSAVAQRAFLGAQAAEIEKHANDKDATGNFTTSREERIADFAKIRQLSLQTNQVNASESQKTLEIDNRQAAVLERLKDQYSDLRVALLATTPGAEVQAALAQFDASHRDILRTLDAEATRGTALEQQRASAAAADIAATREQVASRRSCRRQRPTSASFPKRCPSHSSASTSRSAAADRPNWKRWRASRR
jgi:hypothetical protein